MIAKPHLLDPHPKLDVQKRIVGSVSVVAVVFVYKHNYKKKVKT